MGQTNQWLVFALGSAFFAALTAIFGKLGVSEINSNFATLIRTVVILAMLVCIVTFRKEWQPWDKISPFGLGMLVLSAIATGLSWLCYYRALQLGPASRVAPIDKLSIALVIILSVLFLGESLTWKLLLGALLIVCGTLVIAM
jgi:transporter family protein